MFDNVTNADVNEHTDISKIVIEIVRDHFWTLEEEIFFFTQPGVMNLTFPCTTSLGGLSPGKPCVFPVTWVYFPPGSGNDTFDGCISAYDMGSSDPGCFTRVYGDNIVDSNDQTDNSWGYCPDTCHGEQPTPSSPYNLALSKFIELWKSDLYDLGIYTNGYCHTYDPPVKSEPDLSHRLYFRTSRPPVPGWAYFPSQVNILPKLKKLVS